MQELNFEKIGQKLREVRISRNLTQEYIANMVDINTSHISNIENNRVKISLTTLVSVCNVLGTTVDYILADEYSYPSSALDREILKELRSCDNKTREQILSIVRILK